MNYLLAFKEFLLALKPQPSKITVKSYAIDVKHFIVWAEEKFGHSFEPKNITAEDIALFRQDKANQLSARSLDRHISSLRKFFHALKLQGVVAQNPFDSVRKAQITTDPFHLKEFKDFLYVYNASNLTIKNYIIDVKQFLQWAQGAAATRGVGAEDVLGNLSDQDVAEYRDRLLAEHVFSPASINRKLSSLRKYLGWAASQNLVGNKKALQDNLNAVQNVISAKDQELPKLVATETKIPVIEAVSEKPQSYSSFPPFRLAQKVARLGLIIFDTVITVPLAHLTAATQKTLWTLQGKPLFKKQETASVLRPAVRVKNISKATYAPSEVSIKNLPWLEKIIFHARHTRPQWYRRYHSYAIAHYFNWAILMIFMTVIGFGFYNSFVTKPGNSQPLLAATAPPRILSFQGRLTDSANNPITTATNLRFGIYTDPTSTGSALLWQEVDNVQPDGNGVFSVILGKNSAIQQSLFANNQNLYLGITVGTTPELTPRQQLATVAYATNAETLQGLPPITQSGAGTNNVVLALDSTGNLTIGAASTFQTVGGTFTLSGNTLMLTTNAGTNGNVAISPNGTGFIDLQKPLINSTLNNNIQSAAGAVEVDDNFAVLATTSGIPAVTIDQNGSGAIFTASSSGIERFTIGNAGTIKATNYTAQGGVLYTDSTGLFLQTGTSNNTQCLIGGTAPTWTACSNIGQNFWQISNGALVPVNSTVDLFVGGTSTASAKFGVLNINSGTPTASISSGLNGTATFMTADGTIQTANFQGLTIGGTTTGNIALSPQNGSGTVTINGALAITGQLTTSLIPSSTSINLGSPTNPFGNIYLSSTGGIGGYWQLQNGALSPTNISNDVLIGSTASGSARFHAYATGGTVPAASASAKTSYAALVANNDGVGDVFAASSSSIPVFSIRANGQIVANQYNTAGGVFYTNSSGLFQQASNASANTVLHGGATPTFSAVSLTADVTGILPLANGGTNANLTADSGGIVYSGASNLAILAHASSVGQCLVSGGTSAPSWSSCSSAAANWWVMNAGTVFPINNTLDMTLGSSDGTGSSASAKFAVLNMSGSGTPTASVSSGLNGTGMYFDANGEMQTVRNMTMTIGGNTTGNIILAPSNGNGTVTVNGTGLQTNAATFNLLTSVATTVNFAQAANNINVGNAGGTTTFASAAINDNQSTVSLLGSPTTVNFAAGATTALNIGGSTSPTNLNGNVVIGTNNTNTFTPNALMNVDLIPTGNGAINLGSSSHYYNTVYANNFVAPVSGGTSGFWSLANDVIFPVNTYFDLAIGGTSTASADWQVYSENLGSIVAGTATSSGMLSFRNAATKINLLNGAQLDIQTSVGGDAGLASVLNIANNGNMTATGNLALNGGTLSTTQSVASLFNTTASTVNIAGGASTATNIGHASGQIFLRGNAVLGTNNTNTITPNGEFIGSLIPQTTNTYDLGTSTLAWKNLYISGNYAGFWQRFLGVVSPYNITDDLAIGGTASGSAPFQVFGLSSGGAPAGTASTSGQLTFRANSQVNLLNNATLGFYNSVGGDSGISAANPVLYLANNGHVGINTTSPSSPLSINVNSGTTPDILLGDGTNVSNYISLSGGRAELGYDGTNTLIQGNSTHGIRLGVSAANTFGTFTNGLAVTGINGFVGIGTTTIGNAELAVNQTNISGLGDIFTASAASVTKFTIANDGTIKNDLIPNITDTYNLGSDPSLPGGREWNNLYVRQIITPATGGIAGYWQLNNNVLSPTNSWNDLVVGGTSTASARFQVFATGSGAGSIAATLNNPQVNNNAGSLLASTNIINIGSANHTYMSLNNSDLTIGGHKNIFNLSNVQKVYVYDTTKDTDGGAWTNDERAQANSWYNEARTSASSCVLGTNTRCGQQAFPRKVILVATSTNLYIFDAKDNSLWMEFIGGAHNMLTNGSGTITGLTALNGEIYVSYINSGTSFGLNTINFINDKSYSYGTNTKYSSDNKGIANRNVSGSGDAMEVELASNAGIVSANVNDVSAAVINGKTYFAVATGGNTNGSITLIDESDLSFVANFAGNVSSSKVWLTSTGTLYSLVGNASTPANYALKAKYNVQNISLNRTNNNQTFDVVYATQSTTNYGVTTTDNNTFGSLVLFPGPAATTAAQMNATSLYVTQGTSTNDGVSNTIYIGEGGSDGAVAALQENQASPAAGTVKYYKKGFITDDMVGDTRGYWPLNETAGNLADASIRGNTLIASSSGVTYSASGVRGTAITLDGLSGYLDCPQASCGGVNSLDVPGSAKTISVGAWVKTSASGARQVILSKWNNTISGSYLFTVESSGKVMWALNGLTTNLYSIRSVNDGNWHYVVATYDGANMDIYIDGQFDAQQGKTGAFSSTTEDFLVGAYFNANFAAGWFNGSIDQPFVSATTMEASEITHNYQVGYRALQNHSAQTIRGTTINADASQQLANSNGNVSAISAYMPNGQLYIGTNNGGVSVIGMDSDTVKDVYNAGITTTDDIGSTLGANNNYIKDISVGQTYGNGTILSIGSNNAGSGGTWMESQDTTLKDFFASNFNPFGATLNQNNLNIDNVLRVTNQLSTRLDNLAYNATSSAVLNDIFRVDGNGMAMDVQSTTNNSAALITQTLNTNPGGFAAALDVVKNYTGTGVQTGLEALTATGQLNGSGTITNLFNLVSNPSITTTSTGTITTGTGLYVRMDNNSKSGGSVGTWYGVHIASASGDGIIGTQYAMVTDAGAGNVGIGTTAPAYPLDVNGSIRGAAFYDQQNTAYYLDPAATGTSLTTAGSVGIGTTGPVSALDVRESVTNNPGVQFSQTVNSTGINQGLGLYPTETSASGNTFQILRLGGTTNGAFTEANLWGITITAPTLNGGSTVTNDYGLRIETQKVTGVTNAYGLRQEGANDLNYFAGSVGIGNASPQNKLSVYGDYNGNTDGWAADPGFGQLVVHGSTNTNLAFGIGVDTTNSVIRLQGQIIGTGSLPIALNPQGNNVTIGTTANASGYRLEVAGDIRANGGWLRNNGQQGWYNDTYGGGLWMTDTTWIRIYGGKNFWGEGGTIATNGSISAGTSSTSRKLFLYGGGNGGGQQATFENTATGGNSWAVGPDDSKNCFTLYPTNGSGMYTCPGQGGWGSNSDQRLKTNIEPITNGLGVIRQLNPVTFNWKDVRTPTLQLGFVAQQVQQILPELVREQGTPYTQELADGSMQTIDNPLGLTYQGLIAPAISAIQELDASNSANMASIQQLQSLELTDTGTIAIQESTPSADFTVPTYYTLNDLFGNPINRMGAFVELVAANLRVGSLQAQQTITNTLAVTTDNVSIAGQSLRDYILNVVQSAGFTSGTLSPIASVDQLHTNLISPLATDSAIAVDLTGSKFTIRNSATGSAVASVDNVGNATFSGTLNSQNLAVNSDATVSGTLRAHRIVADDIEGLAAAVGTLSAQNITNVTNIYFATPSSAPVGGNIAMGQSTSSSSTSGLLNPNLSYASVASFSSYLAYVPNLSASTALFDQGLTSLGPTALSDTTITGQLSIGTSLVLADNSINVLGSSFEIQPLRQGGVNFEGGLLTIDTDGNLTVNGNAVFAKTLAAHIISPLSNNDNLTFKLGQNPTATGSALATANLAVQNASGSGIFTVDQLGNLMASGAANIAKLNFNLVQPALAVSSTEVIATGSAGTAEIKSHQTEVTIDNTLVTDKSLIYITPVGQSGVTPYLIRQVNKTSFTVGISLPQYADTTFNWLIVN